MQREPAPKTYHLMYEKDGEQVKMYENPFGYWRAFTLQHYYQEYRGLDVEMVLHEREVKNAK